MSSIFRREYKRKDQDIALEEASTIISDLNNWESEWPTLIEKLSSERSELRLSAMQSMNKILTAKFIGEEIMQFLNNTVLALIETIKNPASKNEHDEALAVICNLSLNVFDEFESCAITLLNEIMPNLKNITEEQAFQFFAIAFTSSFSISHHDITIKVFNKLTDFITKKKSPNFTPEMIANCISSIRLIISSLPVELVSTELYPNLTSILDNAFSTQKHKIIMASIPLFGIIYEILRSYEDEAEEKSEEITPLSKPFFDRYRPRLQNLSKSITKKDHKKEITNEVGQAIATINDDFDEEIILSHQSVHIIGRRNNLKVSAIRRITRTYFLQQMTQNTRIHQMFGFELMSHTQALRIKKGKKGEVHRERIINAKEREKEIAKQRKRKDIREGMFNEDD
ncbi:hypothetical protein GPJ56_001713 [Histomonas meleagridis]|uniref:uncharacterized protein n=1 Tax=Histomonas meleagridis TaxID=135588 RepID=UPI00355A0EEF|nr:hypothetical protein GPJ56_001713 [Histomonas meleagridis]KAH0796201.1 hypothetical protein GO595_010094 [Histomonas meleagridis]